MAGKKISQLPSGSLATLPLNGLTPVVHSGVTYQHTLTHLRQILVDSGSHVFTGSQVINGNLKISGSITAQEYILSSSITHITTETVSGSSNFGNSSDDKHTFTGSMLVSGSLVVNGIWDKEGLYVSGPTVLGETTVMSGSNAPKLHVKNSGSVNIAHFEGYNEYYAQVNITNLNSGSLASSDLVLTADNGNETVHFVDLGINSSTYNGGYVGYENDAYLLNVGKDLYIGTVGGTNHPAELKLFANNSWENPQITIHTGSQITFNTSSFTEGYTYEFSGSLNLHNELNVNGSVTASYFIGDGSQLTNLPIPGFDVSMFLSSSTFTSASASFDQRIIDATNEQDLSSYATITSLNQLTSSINNLTNATSSYLTSLGSGLISGSSQISFTGITDIPSGLVSGSPQISYTGITDVPSGIVSSSAQILESSNILSGSVSFDGLVSGSPQISYTGITDVPSGLVSGSSQILDGSGVWSGSAQLPSGLVSGSSQISYTGITDVPSGLVSGSSQLTSSFDNRYVLESETGSFAITGSNIFNGTQTITGSVNITGNITATSASFLYINTVYETASIIYSSGSNQLGDASNDTQTLYGTVILPNGPLSVTGSINASSLTGSLNWNNLTNIPTLVSGSSQISYNGITDVPSGLVSGSSQISFTGISNVPSGLVSGSSQVLDGSGVWSGSAQLPSGIVSGSSQISYSGLSGLPTDLVVDSDTGSFLVTGSVSSNILTLTKGDGSTFNLTLPSGGGGGSVPAGTVSGSIQVDHNLTTNYVANEHINHTGVTISAGNGLLGGGDITTSRTLTLDTGSSHFTNGVKSKMNLDGVISGSSQVLNGSGVWSGSAQLPSGIVSGSSQITYSGITGIPAGLVSGSSQIDHNLTTNFVANKHIDHTTVVISGTTGLSGGGDITTSRNITLDTGSATFNDGVKAKMNTENVVSGSLQITNFGFATTGSGTIIGNEVISGSLVVTGSVTIVGSITERLVLKPGSGSVAINFDYNSGSIFYLSGSVGNNTFNVQNMPTTAQRSTALTFVIEQGATPYSASAYQFDGVSQTVKWSNGATPTGNANKTDVIGLTAFRSGSTWNILGTLSTFG